MNRPLPFSVTGLAACGFLLSLARTSVAEVPADRAQGGVGQASGYYEGPWQPGDPIPQGYRETTRLRGGFIGPGNALLWTGYGTSLTAVALSALVGGASANKWLAVPGAGPLITMAQTTNPGLNVLFAADALAQLSGIAMIVYALAEPVPALVRQRGSGTSFAVTPLVGAGRTGLGVVGTF